MIPKCKCGEDVQAADKFCKKCGRKLFVVMRSKNEVIAERNRIMRNPPDCLQDAAMKSMAIVTLNWVLGAMDDSPLNVMNQARTLSRDIRRNTNQGC